jgi:hypothetical protein
MIEYCYAFGKIISRKFAGNEELWKEVFGLLKRQTTEMDLEIRNTSLDIFAGIIGLFGTELRLPVWQLAIEDIYLRLFDSIFEISLNLLREEIKTKYMPGITFITFNPRHSKNDH